jgi:hypothetical protein
MPADYYWRGFGEKIIIREFIAQEMKDRKEEIDGLNE